MQKPVWIIGCGDIGLRVGKQYIAENNLVKGLVSSEESGRKCQLAGIDRLVLDLDSQNLPQRNEFSQCDLFYFAPPPQSGLKDTRLQRFLDHVAAAPRRIVLISTTGVYGDCDGGWVDENSPTDPKVDRAVRRLDAEHSLIAWSEKNRGEYIILRVPGIYAADRLPLARIEKGLPVVRTEEAPWTNRIHADDLARICIIVMKSSVSNTIYNACDSHPGTMTDYFNQVADKTGLPRPPQITMAEARVSLSPGMVSYLSESRRVSNRKMLADLDIILEFPTLQDGLKQLESTSELKR